ncbi:MAG: hypothetical protein DRP85_05295 [Candidatus Makaraimicrobium thalassicum]|nr:MAG: hypothetical protein DRP85_05295 [Candidatus Omnitrophota bacterium]
MKKAGFDIRYVTYLICVFLLFSTTAGARSGADEKAEQALSITAALDRDKASIGDRIKLDVVAVNSAGFELSFPEVPDELGEFSFIESHPMRSGWGKVPWGQPPETGREYLVSIYDTGTYVIPPVRVKYRKPGESEWHVLESPQVPIEIVSVLTGEDTDIRDLKGLAVFGADPVRLIFVLIVIFAAAAVLWILWRRKVKKTGSGRIEKIKPAHEVAYEQLRQLKSMNLPEQGRVKEYYIRLSDIARHYLENRFSYRAPEMTTEEFLETIKRSPEMPNEHKKLLKDFLSHCDMVKFARYGPTSLEVLDSFGAAERLVDQTRIEEGKEAEE